MVTQSDSSFRLIIFLIVLLTSVGFFHGCSDSSVGPAKKENGEQVEEIEGENEFHSEYEYNLNVVYFTATDYPPHSNYKERISKMMLYLQDYYRKWMKQWGYGDKTFGLLVNEDQTRVDVIHIEGKRPLSEYPYQGGAGNVMNEVNAYFEKNPDRKTSDHILVLIPDDLESPDVPYYGIGRWAFALDSGPLMDVDNLGAGGEAGKQSILIGGVAHELGHGLNLPHNSHKVSDHQQFGTALMDNGNHSFDKKTFLTPVDAAILNTNQVFNKSGGSFYGEVSASLTALSGHFEDGAVIVEGTFESDTPVTDVIVYQEPAGRSTYNQIGWTTKPKGDGYFRIEMSTEELFETTNKKYQLNVRLVHENGQTSFFKGESYTYTSGTTDLSFEYGAKEVLDKTNWEVTDYSSQEVGHHKLAQFIIDGDYSTFWHSRWSDVNPDKEHPHSLTVDMGKALNVEGFQFVQRQNGQRAIKNMEIKVSSDGENWESLGNHQLSNTTLPQSVGPDALPKQFRYFKIITASAWDGEVFAALAEVGVY